VLLAAGWTALILRARSVGSWLTLGLGAGLVALLIALFDALLIPLFGPGADAALGAVLLIALVAWMIVAPALATQVPPAGSAFLSVGSNIAAGVVWLVAVLVGLVAVGFVIPAGS